jgi:hypothetical protein
VYGDQQDITDRLKEAAERVTPWDTPSDILIRKVVRRRRVQTTAVAAASCLAIVGATVAVRALPGRSEGPITSAGPVTSVAPGGSTVRSSLPSAAPATTSAVDPGQTRHYLCGGQIDPPVVSGGQYGRVRLSIEGVRRAADDTPEVTIALASTQPMGIPAPPGPTNPRILLLKDGVIVAGQDAALVPPDLAAGSHPTAHTRQETPVHVDATHPYRLTLHLPAGQQPCGTTWNQLWNNGSGYQLAVIVSTLELDPSHPSPNYSTGQKIADPLLLTSVTFGTRSGS